MGVRHLFPLLHYPPDSLFPDVARPPGGRQGYPNENKPEVVEHRVTLAKARELAVGIWSVRPVDYGD